MNQQPPPAKKQPTYFIVPRQQFEEHVRRLGRLPYADVASLLQQFIQSSRAMFDPIPKFSGPGGQVVTDPPMGASEKGNGVDQPDAKTDSERPGWHKVGPNEDRTVDAQYVAADDTWWEKDPDNIDKPLAGGAK